MKIKTHSIIFIFVIVSAVCIMLVIINSKKGKGIHDDSNIQMAFADDSPLSHTDTYENDGPMEKEGVLLTDSGHRVVDRNKSKIDIYEPKYTRGVFYSDALDLTRNYIIYLPEGYGEDIDIRYPVLYILRAAEWELPFYALNAYEKLLNEDKIGPMIMVFPNTGKGIAVNYLEPSPAFGQSQFEDYFIDDLIPYIDSNYRTIDSKYARAIDGFSIGGFSALFLAMNHVDLFASVGSFDGTLTPADHSGFFSTYDRHAFGFPLDQDHYSKNNPSNLMRDGDASDLRTINYYIQASASNLALNRAFIEIMEGQGIENGLDSYILKNSSHTNFNMGRHLEITMPLHYEGFNLND